MATLPKGLKAILTKSPHGHKELLATVLRGTLSANPNLSPSEINDVAVGVVLSELGGSKAARMALNHSGFPNSTSLHTVNRACSSSLQSIATISAAIQTGMIDTGIAAGMESMTRNYGSRAIPVDLWPDLRESPNRHARDCIMPMGLTSENVAKRYGVSRGDQDAFAVASHLRAAAAQDAGSFDAEIVPVTTRFQEVDKAGNKVGEEKQITVTRDDGIRGSATVEALAKLKPAFSADGSSTAGNSSQVSDGAAGDAADAAEHGDHARAVAKRNRQVRHRGDSRLRPRRNGRRPRARDPGSAGSSRARDFRDRSLGDQRGVREPGHLLPACARAGGQRPGESRRGRDCAWPSARGYGVRGSRARFCMGLGAGGGEVGVVSMCVGTGMGMAGLFVRE
ncbi:hypothetical protein CIB48_g5454 [Xylaria polymorpha]|nr:hypothetical protein CIB48_g5454 [Xylaria polymorpha]